MRKRISKARNREFLDKATDLIKGMGAVAGPIILERDYWDLDTKYGPLYISVERKNEYVFTVFMKFKDVAKAKLGTDCNPWFGKWNFHIGGQHDVCVVLEELRIKLNKVKKD